MRNPLTASVLVGLLAVCLHHSKPALAQDPGPSWVLGLGGSAASPYTYRTLHFSFGDFDESFGYTWMASIGVNRRLRGLTSLQAGFDYFHEQEDLGEWQSVQLACLSAGIRRSFDRNERARPYIEILPALYAGKWSDDLRDYSVSSLRPGLVAGLGVVGPLVGRVRIDVGMKAHLSTEWPSLGGQFSGRDAYHGVKRFSLGARILYGM
jgi:hypothetical protein